MRTARLVGLSPDGQSLIVATDAGEELAIAADDRLRAAVRGDRPRLGQLEIEMETSLSPRDIQTRIRAGATLEDVARVAGIPMDRVERFAAPVLAERDHVADQAMSGSVRRRGETSGHRNLRITVTERLVTRGIDIDTIDWDSYRLEDGRWTVTADYRSGEAARHAELHLRPPRAVLRRRPTTRRAGCWVSSPPPRVRSPAGDGPSAATGEDDTEPTLDLNDELALVRATQELDRTVPAPRPDAGRGLLRAVSRGQRAHHRRGPPAVPGRRPAARAGGGTRRRGAGQASRSRTRRTCEATRTLRRPRTSQPRSSRAADGGARCESAAPAESPLSTLDQMLGREDYTEDSVQVYAGLSDASAVPETDAVGWEPAIVVNYPVEPSEFDDSRVDHGHRRAPPARDGRTRTADPLVDGAGRAEEEQEFDLRGHAEPPAPKPAKRKRASVPSWDEIMFGGPGHQLTRSAASDRTVTVDRSGVTPVATGRSGSVIQSLHDPG